jgi:hypothetical protein
VGDLQVGSDTTLVVALPLATSLVGIGPLLPEDRPEVDSLTIDPADPITARRAAALD